MDDYELWGTGAVRRALSRRVRVTPALRTVPEDLDLRRTLGVAPPGVPVPPRTDGDSRREHREAGDTRHDRVPRLPARRCCGLSWRSWIFGTPRR